MRSRLGFTRSQFTLALLLAMLLVVVAYFQSQPKSVEPYDPKDTGSSGLRALVLWLEQLGYPVTVGVPIGGLPSGPGLLVISPNNPLNVDYSSDSGNGSGGDTSNDGNNGESSAETPEPQSKESAEVAAAYQWVEQGGTLLLVGPTIPYEPLSEVFGVEQLESFTSMVSDVRQVQPLLPDIPSELSPLLASHKLEFFTTENYGQRSVVPLLSHANGDPVVALQFVGKGVVWHMTEDFAFTNLNLHDERIAALLPAILRTVPAGAPVVISTNHLVNTNQVSGEISTLQDWLYTTPFGQATLLVMVALFVFLLLQGRRLGPALAGASASRPREAAEYVTALAGLERRSRQPGAVAEHHRQRLKSAVGSLAQLPADLPDGEWLRQLGKSDAVSPTLLNEVTELLAGYAQFDVPKDRLGKSFSGQRKGAKNNDEADLIHLVQATDALVAALPRANRQLVR